jgi:tetratricopeptide (TPR) repeat protein
MANLAEALLSDEVRRIHDRRRSGILAVSSGDAVKGLFFQTGRIVFASSTADQDKLGENLIRLGRISRSDFAAAYQASQSPRTRLGQALVGAGLLTEEELGRLVAHQVQKIVLSTFLWTTGEMHFHDAEQPIPADLALDLSTHRLLLEGARIYPDTERLENGLGSLRRRLRVATRAPFDYSALRFSPAETKVLEAAADGMRIAQMLEGPMSRSLLVRGVYALLAGGILEEPTSEETGPAQVETDTGTFRLAHASDPRAPAAPDPREHLLKLYEALPRASHYEILSVTPDASRDDIERAHERLKEADELWEPMATDVRFGSMISTLRLRRREAHRVLSDPLRRAAYDRSLGTLSPAADAPRPTSPAEPILKEGVALLSRGDQEAAIAFLLEAVREDPKLFPARRVLAVTLSRHASLSRTAERHFLAALEMEPGDVDLRYQFALYYRKAGLRARAMTQLRTLLEVDSRHMEARQALKTLEAEATPFRPRS